jgi:hypothetical protein
MTTEKFAKLFEDEKYGQILVIRDTDDEGEPCVKVMAQPHGLGICAVSLAFSNDEDAQATFERMELEHARAGVADLGKFGAEV